MADKESQSRVVVELINSDGQDWGTLVRTDGGRYYAITEGYFSRLKEVFFDDVSQILDMDYVLFETTANGTKLGNADAVEEHNNNKGISIKIDVDVSEAITGLKAVQREARMATKELRELEIAAERLGKINLDSGAIIAEGFRKLAEAGESTEELAESINEEFERWRNSKGGAR